MAYTISVIVKTVSLTLPRIDDNIKRFRAICMKHNFERDVNVLKAWVWTTKFDTATWPFLKFDMRHGALVTRQKGENL